MNRKGIQEIRAIQREHIERVLAKTTPLGIPETVIRLTFDLLLVHVLMTGENGPCKHMTNVRERHRCIAQFAEISEQKAAWLYDKYLEAVEMFPDVWPDFSKPEDQTVMH